MLILENPYAIVAIGLVVTVFSGLVWLRTSFKPLFYGMIGTPLLAIMLLIVEWAVETDREVFVTRLDGIAHDVMHNDLAAVLSCIHPGFDEARKKAESELRQYTFQRVSIKKDGLTVEIVPGHEPRKAFVRFNATAVLREGGGVYNRRPIPRFVVLTFLQKDGEWLVSDYSHYDAQQGFKKNRETIY